MPFFRSRGINQISVVRTLQRTVGGAVCMACARACARILVDGRARTRPCRLVNAARRAFAQRHCPTMRWHHIAPSRPGLHTQRGTRAPGTLCMACARACGFMHAFACERERVHGTDLRVHACRRSGCDLCAHACTLSFATPCRERAGLWPLVPLARRWPVPRGVRAESGVAGTDLRVHARGHSCLRESVRLDETSF